MESVLGILTVVFFCLAATNKLRRSVKNKTLKKVISYHYVYGAIAVTLALVHMVIVLINGDFRITGLIALIMIIATGTFGGAFKKLRKKNLFKVHQVIGPLTFVAILIHIIFNSSF